MLIPHSKKGFHGQIRLGNHEIHELNQIFFLNSGLLRAIERL
jgi:hypothetical protein